MRPDLAYLAFGTVLVLALVAIAAFYYSGKRKGEVERPKHKMLDDDE